MLEKIMKEHKTTNFVVSSIRIYLGIWFIHHGYTKFLFKPFTWAFLGQPMQYLGFTKFPALWGAIAVFTFIVGGVLLALGILSRVTIRLLSLKLLKIVATKS